MARDRVPSLLGISRSALATVRDLRVSAVGAPARAAGMDDRDKAAVRSGGDNASPVRP
jgi:hypothetical protein